MLEPQLHCGILQRGDTIYTNPEPGSHTHMNKPLRGFWTSTYKEGRSDWIRFVKEEHGPHDSLTNGTGYIFDVEPDANLLVIDGEYDWYAALRRYKLDDYYNGDLVFDWDEIAEHYDGLHATKNGYPYMHKFDCESTVWFRPRFTAVTLVDIDVYIDTERERYP